MLVNGYKIAPRENLSGANLRGAYLRGADLCYANLSHADLQGANLGDVDLIGANLTGANLTGANLVDTDLNKANLEGANLRGANLKQTNYNVYDLVGAELENCVISAHLFRLIPDLYAGVHFKVDLDPHPCSENIAIYLNLLVSIARIMGITERADLVTRLKKERAFNLVLEAIESTNRTEDILQLMSDAALNMRQREE